jgi:hypothetical protein
VSIFSHGKSFSLLRNFSKKELGLRLPFGNSSTVLILPRKVTRTTFSSVTGMSFVISSAGDHSSFNKK